FPVTVGTGSLPGERLSEVTRRYGSMMATLSAPMPRLGKQAMFQIAVYFGLLTLFSGVGSGLTLIPVLFFLKNQLKLGPQQMALFQVLTGIPTYLGFL